MDRTNPDCGGAEEDVCFYLHGSATVRNGLEYRVKDVANNKQDKSYQLEFRVTAYDSSGNGRSSEWTKLRSQRIRNRIKETNPSWSCSALDTADKAYDAVSVLVAIFSGGYVSGLAAVAKGKGRLTPNVAAGVKMLLGCYDDPVDALEDIHPLIKVILNVSGISQFARCFNGTYTYMAEKTYVSGDGKSTDRYIDGLLGEVKTCR